MRFDTEGPPRSPVIAQVFIAGGRHMRVLGEPVANQGHLPGLTRLVRSNAIVALDEGTGDSSVIVLAKHALAKVRAGFCPDDLPALSPGGFRQAGRITRQEGLVNKTEAVRLAGACSDRCTSSWNLDPWKPGRRLLKLVKAVGRQTIGRDGRVRSGVVYQDKKKPSTARRFMKVFDTATGLLTRNVVVAARHPEQAAVSLRQRRKPQPSEGVFQKTLQKGRIFSAEDIPW